MSDVRSWRVLVRISLRSCFLNLFLPVFFSFFCVRKTLLSVRTMEILSVRTTILG